MTHTTAILSTLANGAGFTLNGIRYAKMAAITAEGGTVYNAYRLSDGDPIALPPTSVVEPALNGGAFQL